MGKYEEVLEEGGGPRVPRSQGPKDQGISNSRSNTSLTLKKVRLVSTFSEKSEKQLNLQIILMKSNIFLSKRRFYCLDRSRSWC